MTLLLSNIQSWVKWDGCGEVEGHVSVLQSCNIQTACRDPCMSLKLQSSTTRLTENSELVALWLAASVLLLWKVHGLVRKWVGVSETWRQREQQRWYLANTLSSQQHPPQGPEDDKRSTYCRSVLRLSDECETYTTKMRNHAYYRIQIVQTQRDTASVSPTG